MKRLAPKEELSKLETFTRLREKIRVVIFAGGFGTRMWPMSRQSLPKQFQPLLGDKSFFQDTVDRLKLSFLPKDIFVSVPQEQVKFIKDQAPEIPHENIIAEPERRDTLGAIGYVNMYLDRLYPGSLVAITWCDHFIRERERYARLFWLAAGVCQTKNVICKIDVRPPYPATQLGWIKIGKKAGKIENYSVYEFVEQIEKPELSLATKMFTQKNWLINSGYYVWRTTLMSEFYKKYNPACYFHLEKIRKALDKNETETIASEYREIEKTSVDYGIFEKLPHGSELVIPVDLGWHDVGTWDLFYEALARGQNENITKGEVDFEDATGNLVYIPKKKIAAIIGVEKLVVIDTSDALLICKRGSSKEVKRYVETLKEKGKLEYL